MHILVSKEVCLTLQDMLKMLQEFQLDKKQVKSGVTDMESEYPALQISQSEELRLLIKTPDLHFLFFSCLNESPWSLITHSLHVNEMKTCLLIQRNYLADAPFASSWLVGRGLWLDSRCLWQVMLWCLLIFFFSLRALLHGPHMSLRIRVQLGVPCIPYGLRLWLQLTAKSIRGQRMHEWKFKVHASTWLGSQCMHLSLVAEQELIIDVSYWLMHILINWAYIKGISSSLFILFKKNPIFIFNVGEILIYQMCVRLKKTSFLFS